MQQLAPGAEPAGPRGKRVQGEGCPGASHGWAITPSRTRVSVRRIPRSGVPLRVSCMAQGYARLHPIPAPGTFRVRNPKGHTTARAGSHWVAKEPRPAFGQPWPRSESGTRLGPDLLKLGSQSTRRSWPGAYTWAREEAVARPWPHTGKRCTHHGPDQGPIS